MVVEPDLTMINNLRNEGIAAVNAGDTSALADLSENLSQPLDRDRARAQHARRPLCEVHNR